MELDYKAIGKRIKIARIKADLTQERLAEMVEISPTHMSNIETGTTRVSLTAIVSLANALSVTVDDLLCDSVVKSKVQFEKDIAGILADCDEYEIRIVKDMAQALMNFITFGQTVPKWFIPYHFRTNSISDFGHMKTFFRGF